MTYREMKAKLLLNPEVKEEFEKLGPEYEVTKAVLNARISSNMTQSQLADKTGIDRADISKLENGNANPTVAYLQRIASGLNMRLKIEFIPQDSTSRPSGSL